MPVHVFDPSAYGPGIADLLREPRLAPLGPGQPNSAARPRLAALSLQSALAPRRVVDARAAAACHAGLWLYHDFLDESHTLSQDNPSPEGSYWHAILHRREPDAANASYWFRRVGEHPIFPALARDAQELGIQLPSGRWDPFRFIDLCEQHRDTGTEMEKVLRSMQQREWERLFAWCYTRSAGSG